MRIFAIRPKLLIDCQQLAFPKFRFHTALYLYSIGIVHKSSIGIVHKKNHLMVVFHSRVNMPKSACFSVNHELGTWFRRPA